MSKRWAQEHARDPYTRRAKRENYRSRASYKLKQINNKFHVIRQGDVVVDLGAAPGGWSQVALELVGEEGIVIGVDIDHTKPMEGWIFIRGDITHESTTENIQKELHKREKDRVSVVISDMSANITGIYDVDQANSAYLADMALQFAKENLGKGGNMVCKIFQGTDTQEFVSNVKKMFWGFKRFSPPASRKSSSEIYIIAKAKK